MSLVRRVHEDAARRALEELMFRYRPRLIRKVRVMMSEGLRKRFDIDDVVQSALMKGARDLSRFEFTEPASLIHWLTGIALNEIRAMSRKRLPGSLEEPVESDSGLALLPGLVCERELLPPEQAELEEAKARLDEAIGRLPEHYRDVLLARDYDGGSWDHVAEVMGRSPEACQMIRKRAKDRLLESLRGELQ
jgi:RNA polymerase sigma-70 factor (ECF subfamily)